MDCHQHINLPNSTRKGKEEEIPLRLAEMSPRIIAA